MATFLRIFPGLTALVLSFLSGYVWVFAGPYSPWLFTIAHLGSAVLCLSVPAAFVLIGRATRCRQSLLKVGSRLLLIAGIPVLVANGIYLFSFGSVEASLGDIGGIGLMLLGFVALLLTSLAYTIGLPLARAAVTDNDDASLSASRS